MTPRFEDRNRRIVPRWRTFDATANTQELAPLIKARRESTEQTQLLNKRRIWEHTNSLSAAADYLSAAVVANEPKFAEAAAHFVLQNAPDYLSTLRSLAHNLVTSNQPVVVDSLIGLDETALYRNISELRSFLHLFPRTAVRWIDLARLYETLGQFDHSYRAARIAAQLSPSNRFILRALARLLIHQGRFGEAHDVLTRQERTMSDPWLLATEIVTSQIAGRQSMLKKRAFKMAESDQLSPIHLSELSSALATLEAEAGNSRKAKQWLLKSLRAPTENAIAQAAWLARNHQLSIPPVGGNLELSSHEAQAWQSYFQKDWPLAKAEALEWLRDQPFSRRPALLGSYVASVVLDLPAEGATFAELGLRANPSDWVLLNNVAFALARDNRIVEARKRHAEISTRILDPSDRQVVQATLGLIELRSNNLVAGQRLYQEAIEYFSRKNEQYRCALARYYLVIEESRWTPRIPSFEADLKAARSALEVIPSPDFSVLFDRLGALS